MIRKSFVNYFLISSNQSQITIYRTNHLHELDSIVFETLIINAPIKCVNSDINGTRKSIER